MKIRVEIRNNTLILTALSEVQMGGLSLAVQFRPNGGGLAAMAVVGVGLALTYA